MEAEAFELNTEIVTNKQTHATTAGDLRLKHVHVDAAAAQRWEDSRAKWRQLRHAKALDDFTKHILSAEFESPPERAAFMQIMRDGSNACSWLV